MTIQQQIYHRAAEVCPHMQEASLVDVSLAHHIERIESAITHPALAEESLNQASVQAYSQPGRKASSPV